MAREKNLNAKIRKNLLIINGEEYSCESLRKNLATLDESINEVIENHEEEVVILNQNLEARSSSEPGTPKTIEDIVFIKPDEVKKRISKESPAENKPKRERSNTRKKKN